MRLAQAARALRERPAPTGDTHAERLPQSSGVLDEHASKRLLAAAEVPVTADRILPPPPAAAADLAGLTYPVALKIVSADIAHKSDVGGVRLNLHTEQELKDAVADMLTQVRQAAPHAKLDGLLIAPMIEDGLETMVGVINDEIFGPVVAFGLGGTLTELLRDMSYRVAPFDEATAAEMIRELRTAAIFDGYRGQTARDTTALAQTLAAVSRFAWTHREQLAEMDINPLLVLAAGKGVVAVDALIVLR